jgi:hypothetical protein
MKKKKIKVKIKNKHLNALEDLLFCNLSKSKEEKYIKKSKKLWTTLVKAYDKK